VLERLCKSVSTRVNNLLCNGVSQLALCCLVLPAAGAPSMVQTVFACSSSEQLRRFFTEGESGRQGSNGAVLLISHPPPSVPDMTCVCWPFSRHLSEDVCIMTVVLRTKAFCVYCLISKMWQIHQTFLIIIDILSH